MTTRLRVLSSIVFLTTTSVIAGCASMTKPASLAPDNYVWMEDSKDARVMPWVESKNAKSSALLMNDPRYATVSREVRKIATSKERIPMPSFANGNIRNFWRDNKNVRGLWRETTFAEYWKPNPKWETILDVDALGKKEGKSWVLGSTNCLAPDYDLCLLELSDAGRDEVEVREFQVSKRAFVKDGYFVPPAKTFVSWVNKDLIYIGSNFGPGSLTDSGYPRVAKAWKRGTPLSQAETVFEGKVEDVSAGAYRSIRPEGSTTFLYRGVSFFEQKTFVLEDDGAIKELPFPLDSSFQGEFKGYLFALLRTDWKIGGKTFLEGSVVSLPKAVVGQKDQLNHLEVVFAPDSKSAFTSISFSRNFIQLSVLANVKGEVHQISRKDNSWVRIKHPFASSMNVDLVSLDPFDVADRMFFSNETFIEPTTLFFMDGHSLSKSLMKVKQLPAQFDSKNLTYRQYEATSKDGTKVPYFVVHKKDMKFDGNNPTLLYGYGGFEASMTPYYLRSTGKVWSEKGGVFVLANIRGGGEFGPRWHRAALKENRQRAFDDFAAIAEDLFARKITSPRRLGIQGGSNGGLLVGAAFTQNPTYYNGVVCEAALLDMIRYPQMPPGASWMGEYGDPSDPKMAAVIAKYSPYQNVKAGVKYPQVFFYTSTADDRVQPGHTRKMVARMEEQGHDVLLFENTEGGHGGAADLEQSIKMKSLEIIYLHQKLID